MKNIPELIIAFEVGIRDISLQLLFECETLLQSYIRSETFVIEYAEIMDEIQQALAATCRAIVLREEQKASPSGEYFECIAAIGRYLIQIGYHFDSRGKIKKDRLFKQVKERICADVPRKISHSVLDEIECMLNALLAMDEHKNDPKLQQALALISLVARMKYEHRILGKPLSLDYFTYFIHMRRIIIELAP